MITLTLKDGAPIAVNPMLVFYVTQLSEGCIIMSPYAERVEVKESFSQVRRAMSRWARGGAE